jgi:hypothetical protein
MRRWTLATAMTVLLTATACGGSDDREAEVQSDDTSSSDEIVVPVERSTDLVDPEGSVLGTAWIRDSENDYAELELQVAGLTAGFHGVRLFETGSCEDLASASSAVLPPMLVLDNGVGSITTLIGDVTLEELVEEGDVTVVLDQAVPALGDVGTGSQLACGAFTG